MTVRNLARTMSGQPGRQRWWRRKRNPIVCRKDRTITSGSVFLERIWDIVQLRRETDMLSDILGSRFLRTMIISAIQTNSEVYLRAWWALTFLPAQVVCHWGRNGLESKR